MHVNSSPHVGPRKNGRKLRLVIKAYKIGTRFVLITAPSNAPLPFGLELPKFGTDLFLIKIF